MADVLQAGSFTSHEHKWTQHIGYLGAGRMSVFGDVEAANRVTKGGRETLGRVTRALSERGVTLIEADTDGVYFSVPESWSEREERGVISEVDALLPDGVTLEFDGRWAAMLSHEIKNYALLRYDGTLEMKGAAFTSSRGEAYGQAFLRRAVTCLLEGDVPGIRKAYVDTLEEIRGGQMRNADVASRVRLTKGRDEYVTSRRGRPEPVYEALLRAERDWRSGEKVNVYVRTDDGLSVLTHPAGHDYDPAHYASQLLSGYATRLRKGLSPVAYMQIFAQKQPGLFDQPLSEFVPCWKSA